MVENNKGTYIYNLILLVRFHDNLQRVVRPDDDLFRFEIQCMLAFQKCTRACFGLVVDRHYEQPAFTCPLPRQFSKGCIGVNGILLRILVGLDAIDFSHLSDR